MKFFDYKNISGRTGAAIGNHDFDFGLKNMNDQFSKAHFPHLAANIYNKSENNVWNFSNTFPHKIFQVGGLKVGVIGLTTMSTPHTTATDVSELIFEDHVNITIEQSRILKEKGVDIVLLVAHVGVVCKNGDLSDNHHLDIRNKSSKAKTSCSESDELYSFLNKLPAGTLDGVVGGHKHTIVHHWLNDIPVMVGDCNARHFNVLYLTYDKINKKIISDYSKIEGPVPVCESIFNYKKTCFPQSTNVGVNTTFFNFSYHNKIIQEDLPLKDLLHPYLEKAEDLKGNILGYIANPMLNSNDDESEMGNFVADAIRKHSNADVVLLNRGMMRVNWQEGIFSFYDLYETFPFEDAIVSFEVTGRELISIVQTLQEGYLGFYISSGLIQNVCSKPHSLVNVTLENNIDIELDKIYKIGTIQFIMMGGDDFADVLKYYTPKNFEYFEDARSVIGKQILEAKILNANGNRFINQKKRRLIVHDCNRLELPTLYSKYYD